MLFNFIYSLFNDHVNIYQTGNDGDGYNLGYVIGTWVFFGDLTVTVFRWRCLRR